jgi:hypothetical protein
VYRGGRETEVSVTARHRAEWPAPAEAEANLWRAID